MSYTPYYPSGWLSGETGNTPITPEALNCMEKGIGDAHTAAESAASSAASANTAATNANTKATAAQTTANAAMPKAGGKMTGAITLNGIYLTEGVDYGTSLPTSAPKGKLFFKKVT